MDRTEAVNKFFTDVLKDTDDVSDLNADILAEEVLEIVSEYPENDISDLPAEMEAMQGIVKALDGLSSSACSRVLRWASERFSSDDYY